MKKIIPAILITIFLLYILISKITYNDFDKLFSSISALRILGIWLVYFVYLQLIRLRFSVLIHSKKIKAWSFFSIITIHNFYNRFLPLKTGEVSYVYMLRQKHKIPAAEGTATLIIARIFDYVTVSFLFAAASLYLIKRTPAYVTTITAIISGLLILSLIFLFFIAAIGSRMINLLEKFINKTGLNKFSASSIVLEKSSELNNSFETISSKSTYLYTFIFSVLIWLSMFFMHYLLHGGMGLNTPFLHVVIGSTFCIFTNILPLHGVAGLGTYETGWSIGYLMMGFTKEMAISSAFIAHLFFLFTGISYGAIGFIIYKLQNSSQPPAF